MTKFRPLSGFAVGLLLALSAPCRAADPPAPAEQSHLTQLGPGDAVSIRVFGQPDATDVYVGEDGTINVPLAGKVPVAGTSPVEAAARVAQALKDGGYFVDPHVTILITQQQGELVSVVGEVQTSGRYPVSPRTTILDLIAQAGGVKATASNVGYVLHNQGGGEITRYPVDLRSLADGNAGKLPFQLSGGDSLVVPRAEHCFVTGAVTTPGSYPIEPGMTVMQVIAQAGGINERGSERRIQVRRRGKDGQYRVLHVKLGDPIQADDIIRVRESIF